MADYQMGVSEFIRQLRSDLENAIDEEANLRFDVKDLEVELQVVASTKLEGEGGTKGGFRLAIFSAEADARARAARESGTVQTVRLKLRPQRRIEDEEGAVSYEYEDVQLAATAVGDD